jgi:hypothetical protein
MEGMAACKKVELHVQGARVEACMELDLHVW